jgi:hypothetical protein
MSILKTPFKDLSVGEYFSFELTLTMHKKTGKGKCCLLAKPSNEFSVGPNTLVITPENIKAILDTFSQVDLANWLAANPTFHKAVELRVRYDFTDKDWDVILPKVVLSYGPETAEALHTEQAVQFARQTLREAGKHAVEVRWNFADSKQGHYIRKDSSGNLSAEETETTMQEKSPSVKSAKHLDDVRDAPREKSAAQVRQYMALLGWESKDQITSSGWGVDKEGKPVFGYMIWFRRWSWHGIFCDVRYFGHTVKSTDPDQMEIVTKIAAETALRAWETFVDVLPGTALANGMIFPEWEEIQNLWKSTPGFVDKLTRDEIPPADLSKVPEPNLDLTLENNLLSIMQGVQGTIAISDLIKAYQERFGAEDENRIKRAMWYWLGNGGVQLTLDRKLKLAEEPKKIER